MKAPGKGSGHITYSLSNAKNKDDDIDDDSTQRGKHIQ